MKKLSVLIMLLAPIMFFSCNKLELSNVEAEALIKKSMNLPQNYTISFDNLSKKNLFNRLQQNGLITWKYKWRSSYSTSNDCDISITDKGKPFFLGQSSRGNFIVYKFKSYTIDFNSITGILINKENQSATVRYTLKVINVTPFAEALQNTKYVRHPLNSDINGELVFKKFDTGWQLDYN